MHNTPCREELINRTFRNAIATMIIANDERGRGADLDRVVSYSQNLKQDVSRLTAVLWTLDEDYWRPVKKLIDDFRRDIARDTGKRLSDEQVYDIMLSTYQEIRQPNISIPMK